ncbi:MAG: hypothetical protein ACYC3A_05815 [Halothiobacillus sp.]
MSEPWFDSAIGVGLAKIAALQLPGTPIDSKTASAMRAVWVESLWPMKNWTKNQDQARIEAAFIMLMRTSERFPAPTAWLRTLPERAPQAKLPPPKMSEAQRQANLARVRALIKTAFTQPE